MKILEIYIDGYKNITNTRLRFDKPIVVLISKNNYGKTNLLKGVREGFRFLKFGLTNSRAFNSAGFQNRFSDTPDNFTFEVRFKVSVDHSKTYIYKYSVGNCVVDGELGICEEELSYLVGDDTESEVRLFYRPEPTKDKYGQVFLHKDEGGDPGVFHANNPTLSFHLRSFATGIRAEEGTVWSRHKDTIKEIEQAYKELVPAGEVLTGEIILHEDSRFREFCDVAKKLYELKDGNDMDISNFEYFQASIRELFPKIQIDSKLDANDKPQLTFNRETDGGKEGVETLSFGTRRVIRFLFDIFISENPLVSMEELEIGIHPKLFTKTLNKLSEMLENKAERNAFTRIVVTSHSTNLINKLLNDVDALYFGLDGYEKDRFYNARFAGFSVSGRENFMKRIEDLNYTYSIGDIIYDYDEHPKYAQELLSWLDV
ncbi:MAG: AAA family ATPase [Defluviitaleaceae bacterium]|nr:AAA family ATPase [Defluviitaleaceae bacterium]